MTQYIVEEYQTAITISIIILFEQIMALNAYGLVASMVAETT